MSLDRIQAAIPHREPFLLLDMIVEQDERRIVCRKTFSGEEFWFRGHYPDFPVTPGALLCEAAMQAGAVLLSGLMKGEGGEIPVATRIDGVRFKKMVRPGDTIEIEVTLDEQLSGAYYMTGRVTVGGKSAARLSFACMLVKPE